MTRKRERTKPTGPLATEPASQTAKPTEPVPVKAIVKRKQKVLQTGPKTEQGKAIAAQNATKHGLNAKSLILPHAGETAHQFRQHLAGYIESMKPADALEPDLVEQIAELMWRQRRVVRYRVEATKFTYGRMDAAAFAAFIQGEQGVTVEKLRPLCVLPDALRLPRADKHEAHNMKMLRHLLAMLAQLQARGSADVTVEETVETKKGQNETPAVEHRRRSTKRIRLNQPQTD
jgi:hypothetical protein